jgi:diaminopimelate epimerase
MPGGTIDISVADDFSISMTGPVTKVADGTIIKEMFEQTV